MPETEFDIGSVDALPRVDITYAYVGSDGTAVRAFVAAGARGIVSAGFAPGFPGEADAVELAKAVEQGIVVVQSTPRRQRPHVPGASARRNRAS